MISPTGKGLRPLDTWGRGKYGVSRGTRDHEGADYEGEPRQDVVAPIHGYVEREVLVYNGEEYTGVVISNNHMKIKVLYLEPDPMLIHADVEQGDVIGTLQDISEKYPGMTPHVHLRIVSIDPEIFITML